MKNQIHFIVGVVGVCAACFLAARPASAADGAYHLLKEIPVSWAGGGDALSLDERNHRLYIVHGQSLSVLDVNQERVVAEMTNAASIKSLALAPVWRRGFWCSGQEPKIATLDLATFKVSPPMKVEKIPSWIFFAPQQGTLFAFNGDQSVSLFEADDGDFMGTIKLPGQAEVAAIDAKSGWIYVAMTGRTGLVVVDPNRRKITNEWDLLPQAGVAAMAFDPLQPRLFIGCRNQTVLMVDALKGKVLQTIPVAGPIADLVWDSAGSQLLISAGGSLMVATGSAMNEFKIVSATPALTGPQAIALDPTTHKVYLMAIGADGTARPATASIGVYGR